MIQPSMDEIIRQYLATNISLTEIEVKYGIPANIVREEAVKLLQSQRNKNK